MTNPHEEKQVDLSEVAAERPDESVAQEREVTGDGPADGDVVPADDAQ